MAGSLDMKTPARRQGSSGCHGALYPCTISQKIKKNSFIHTEKGGVWEQMLKIQLKIHAFILKWSELGHENKTLSVRTGSDGGLVFEVIAQKRV